jgi:hypothetical protein
MGPNPKGWQLVAGGRNAVETSGKDGQKAVAPRRACQKKVGDFDVKIGPDFLARPSGCDFFSEPFRRSSQTPTSGY